MKISTVLSAVVVSAVCMTSLSCKKEYTQVVNQVFSATYSIKPTDWVAGSGNLSYSISLSVPEVDQLIVTNGGVVVYLSLDNGTTFEAVPEEIDGISYGAVHAVGMVGIDYHAVDGVSTVSRPGGTILAKVVLLDGSPL